MIPARRAYLPIAVALAIGLLVGRFGTRFETVALITPLILLIMCLALWAYVDAGKVPDEPEPDPFREAADEP